MKSAVSIAYLQYADNRSRKAAYFLSEKLSYKIFQIVVVRINYTDRPVFSTASIIL